MASLPDIITSLFDVNEDGLLQAQFFSSLACTAVEIELADAQITYKTTIVKSKKRGLVYVIVIMDALEPVEVPHGAGD